jgi:dehydrogenase/reductase SDR family protein 12
MTGAAGVVDAALELLIAPSFTRIGYDVRRRLFDFTPIDAYDLAGRVVVITGATSGLGRAAAELLASCGAEVVAVGRDQGRTEAAAADLRAATGNDRISAVIADVGDLDQVRSACEQILAAHDRLDVLIHNAGALDHQRTERNGVESTIASQVVGPFLMTTLLLDRLGSGSPGRVITVSSGGMYAADLTVDHLQMDADRYDGTKQYALAKRAQVTLNELWADRVDPADVVFHAMHPGWADTPGVAASLPTLRRIVGPFLRSPETGADTIAWLAADDDLPLATSGGFWLDREERPIHRLPSTRRSDTPALRQELWDWVSDRSTGG